MERENRIKQSSTMKKLPGQFRIEGVIFGETVSIAEFFGIIGYVGRYPGALMRERSIYIRYQKWSRCWGINTDVSYYDYEVTEREIALVLSMAIENGWKKKVPVWKCKKELKREMKEMRRKVKRLEREKGEMVELLACCE